MTHGLERVNTLYIEVKCHSAVLANIFMSQTSVAQPPKNVCLLVGGLLACLLVPIMHFARGSTPPDKRILVKLNIRMLRIILLSLFV
jgi:hypothetical protein